MHRHFTFETTKCRIVHALFERVFTKLLVTKLLKRIPPFVIALTTSMGIFVQKCFSSSHDHLYHINEFNDVVLLRQTLTLQHLHLQHHSGIKISTSGEAASWKGQ